jgi:hypothetical protein
MRLKGLRPATRRLDCDELPGPSVRVVAAADRPLDLRPKLGFLGRKAGATDQPQKIRGLRDSAFGIMAWARAQQGLQHPRCRTGQGRIAAGRHQRNEALDALGIFGCDNLRDHAPHRRADNVRAVDVERVHEPDGVAGHVGEAIGRPDPHPQS